MKHVAKYAAGQQVWWRTPGNVSVEQHGVNPHTVVCVSLTEVPDDSWEAYETEIEGYGWVSVLPCEIIGLAVNSTDYPQHARTIKEETE